MKQQKFKFFKSFTKSDWRVFVVFTLLNIVHFILSLYSTFVIALCFKEVFPSDYPPGDFFEIPSLAIIIAKCIVAVFVSILAGIFISKLRVWLLSLPIQLVFGYLAFYLVYYQVTNAPLFAIEWVGPQIAAQVPGVFIGLYIRKRRTRKQPSV